MADDTNIFAPPVDKEVTINTDDISVDTLVGDGRKYATPDDLAKAYANADAHIAHLKAKLAEQEMREKVLKDLEDAKTKQQAPTITEPREPNPPVAPERKDDLSNVDIGELIRKELSEDRKKTSFAENVDLSARKLAEKLGSTAEAQKFVEKKAQELKVDVQWLMDVAGRSPDAFLRTVGINDISVSSVTAGQQGDVNTQAFNRQANRRNFKYYEEVRKTDPKLYYSTEFRKQLFTDARDQGPNFYL